MPLLAIFWRGFSAEDGQGGGWVAARELVTSDNFHWLLGNSLKVSLSVAATPANGVDPSSSAPVRRATSGASMAWS